MKPLAYRLPISDDRRARLDRKLDELPRPREFRDIDTYRSGRDLRGKLWDEHYTMLGSRRGRALYRLARDVENRGTPGAMVDCGVWNGGSSIILGVAAPSRDVWAFDSFEGLPQAGEFDGEESLKWTGECRGAEDKLRTGFAEYADASKLNVRAGWFEDTFSGAAAEIESIALLHCDGDWYDSVRLTLETFYPLVSPGGYVVIDDYGAWPGARRATDEFRKSVGDNARMHRIDYTGKYWQKQA